MLCVIDENIPYADPFFAPLGTIKQLNGRTLHAQQLQDADVLLVRSVTRVNDRLLEQAPKLQFIGTATIGTDHIDRDSLERRGIQFRSAPGCNRISVAEYVIAAMLEIAMRRRLKLEQLTLGIVGVGNIGTLLAEKAKALGLQILLCDPPRARAEGHGEFISHHEILQRADLITYHVPLSKDVGEDSTYHMLDNTAIQRLRCDQILINAARGEIWDNQALLRRQQEDPVTLVMDVWENEPNILQALIPHVALATPHIAGYSVEGRARGTEMLYQALCQHLSLSVEISLEQLLPQGQFQRVCVDGPLDQDGLRRLVKLVYDICDDDGRMRQAVQREGGFDALRKNYPQRREFSSLTIEGISGIGEGLYQVGFSAKGV